MPHKRGGGEKGGKMTIILEDIEHFKPLSKVSNLKYMHD